MPRLRRVDPRSAGYTRRRAGKGFVYLDAAGARVTDEAVLERIARLVIPPAWVDVWVCPLANGHIQATGLDARGRRQYRYHDDWTARRAQAKFDHMVDFARALPTLRARVAGHLDGGGLGCERVLACAVRLLDLGFFRIGSDSYAEENQTYGLATIERRHVRVEGDSVSFDFVAKGSKRRIQTVVDPEVARIVAALKKRRGEPADLLVWRRPTGGGRVEWVDVRSDDINAYVKAEAGIDCSAKDFRTWNATVLAAVALAVSQPATSDATRKRRVARAMAEVAHYLGNTPAVVRSSYVDPRVVDRYLHGQTVAAALDRLAAGVEFGHPGTQGALEQAVLELLDPAASADLAA
ncbi:MAG TPA: hypothetical protein VFP61_02015 [Acidimicrobiales bacterium]|nr:hypothetical protein [Acidimicrobiales bacterium]